MVRPCPSWRNDLPLVAVQMFTFQKGTDNLTELTPPPEEVIPRFNKLSESIKLLE